MSVSLEISNHYATLRPYSAVEKNTAQHKVSGQVDENKFGQADCIVNVKNPDAEILLDEEAKDREILLDEEAKDREVLLDEGTKDREVLLDEGTKDREILLDEEKAYNQLNQAGQSQSVEQSNNNVDISV